MLLNAIIVLLLVFLNGFFVASEFALVKIRESDLRPLSEAGHRRASLAATILANLDLYLSSCQLGITLASLGLGWVGEPMVARSLGPLFELINLPPEWIHYVSYPVAFALITFLHISLGEQVPKMYAISRYQPVSLIVAYPLYFFTKLFLPFIWGLNKASNLMLRMVGFHTGDMHGKSTTEDELRLLLMESKEGGHVSRDEQKMIENVLDLEDKIARRYMVPRTKIEYLDLEDPIKDNLDIAAKCGHTRLPISRGDLENAVGVIHVKKLFQAMSRGETVNDLEKYAGQIGMISETTTLEELLKYFQNKKQHLTLLVDEFGSVSGMITLENILEELVGTIQDEFDNEPRMITVIGKQTYEVLGACPIDRLAKTINHYFDTTHSDTIGGYILELSGHIPETGEVISDGLFDFAILEATNLAIEKIRLTRKVLSSE